jgi:tyrosyl-tRNA synthetase
METMDTRDLFNKLFDRRIENIYPSRQEAIERLSAGTPLRIYFGIDPTGSDVHFGHATAMLFLKKLAELGHKPVLVIGDFTARIGDPTDKKATRAALSKEQVENNMKTYLGQIKKILPLEHCEVRYNSEWLASMNLQDVIGLAGRVTVQQMLVRDMFQRRLKEERPIFIHEFLYPLLQGYDSVALDIDGEVGGNDQTFNMLVGRDLMREMKEKDKLVFSTKLLINSTTGIKMSKTEGEMIALNDSPQEIRRKILDIGDGMIRPMFELCTDVDMKWIEENVSESAIKNDPRKLKEMLSDELVKMYHGLEGVGVSRESIAIGHGEMILVDFILEAGVVHSRSEAKKLIDQKAVMVDDTSVTDWNFVLQSGAKVQVGKGRFFTVG